MSKFALHGTVSQQKSELFNCVPDKFDGVCWRTCYSLRRTAILYYANVFTMLALSWLVFTNWKLVIAAIFFVLIE